MSCLDVLFIEPYDGGSHLAFREGLVRHSRHTYHCLTLPGRFWKWRMRGASAYFADLIRRENDRPCDLIFCTDYLNLADLRGLLVAPYDRVPTVLYMHENQLTYPLSPEEEFDFHFGFTNILSALAADRVVFNSAYHRELFIEAIPTYLGRMPDAVPKDVPRRLAARSSVLPVGIERRPHPESSCAGWLGGSCEPDAGRPWPRGKRPVILWNHRWEFDKCPEMFLNALNRLADAGCDYDLLLMGEPRGHENLFQPLRHRLGEHCRVFGFVPGRQEYDQLLESADIVVSCAAQEYFGISVAEAVHAGAYAVLPRRQVYPSLYGKRCGGAHFYDDEDGLVSLLTTLLTGGDCGHVCSLPFDCDEFCWEILARRYDAFFDEVVTAGG